MFDGVVERLVEQVRAVARAQGELVRLIHEVATATPVPEFAAFEVAAASALSRFSAENDVRLASELCVRLPEVLAAVCAGDLGLRHAHVFADVLSSLDVTTARLVTADVLPRAIGKTCGQLRDMLRRKALAADPAFTTAGECGLRRHGAFSCTLLTMARPSSLPSVLTPPGQRRLSRVWVRSPGHGGFPAIRHRWSRCGPTCSWNSWKASMPTRLPALSTLT